MQFSSSFRLELANEEQRRWNGRYPRRVFGRRNTKDTQSLRGCYASLHRYHNVAVGLSPCIFLAALTDRSCRSPWITSLQAAEPRITFPALASRPINKDCYPYNSRSLRLGGPDYILGRKNEQNTPFIIFMHAPRILPPSSSFYRVSADLLLLTAFSCVVVCLAIASKIQLQWRFFI